MADRDIVDELRFRVTVTRLGGQHTAREVMSDIMAMENARAEIVRLRTAGDALAACVNQFGDTDNWTHDDGFLFHDEALAAVAAWEEVSRG